MQRDKRSVETTLERKGFRRDERKHHFFYYWTLDGLRSSVVTWTSHSKRMKAIGSSLLAKMAKQCYLDRDRFLALVDCPLEQKEYETILQQIGRLPRSGNHE